MNEPVLLDKFLCLPATEIAALVEGRVIAVIPNISVQVNWTFALCPYLESTADISEKYQQRFSSQAATAYNQAESRRIEAWARCESCKLLREEEQVKAISNSLSWTEDALKPTLREKQGLFLALLRVYALPQPIEINQNFIPPEKFGKFVSLAALGEQFSQPLGVSQILPVLNDTTFQKRKIWLEAFQPSPHVELEELYASLTQLSIASPTARLLAGDIGTFLEWNIISSQEEQLNASSDWMSKIASVGNSSDGDLFEKLVRKSMIKLGFTNSLNNSKASLDPDATGGAGGIDVYCNAPFAVIGECKASKHDTVPNGVAAQLINLGNTHLGQQRFNQAVKIIFAAGTLTNPAEQAATQNQMNVIRPDTLQRLVELKARHPGAIDLLELKPCLENPPFGKDADEKVNEYINQVWERLKVRSHLVELVKRIGETSVDVLYGAYIGSQPSKLLDREIIKNILIELASPLTGYLGRRKTNDGDRFYFLRPLDVDPI